MLYVQKPYPAIDTGPLYHFTFKEDQIPLIPVRRTDYGTNFNKGESMDGTFSTNFINFPLLEHYSQKIFRR